MVTAIWGTPEQRVALVQRTSTQRLRGGLMGSGVGFGLGLGMGGSSAMGS